MIWKIVDGLVPPHFVTGFFGEGNGDDYHDKEEDQGGDTDDNPFPRGKASDEDRKLALRIERLVRVRAVARRRFSLTAEAQVPFGLCHAALIRRTALARLRRMVCVVYDVEAVCRNNDSGAIQARYR